MAPPVITLHHLLATLLAFSECANVVLNAKFRLHGVVDSFSLQFCFADLACSIMELSPPPKIKI
jgi:hypothetical protein